MFGLTNQGEKWSYGTTHAEMAAIYLYKLFTEGVERDKVMGEVTG